MSNIQRTNPDSVHAPAGYYSHLSRVKARELLHLAGQVSIGPDGSFVGEGDIKAQVRQIYDNMGRILESAGASFANVVQFTTYIVGRENVADFLEERTKIIEELFPDGDYPPSTLLIITPSTAPRPSPRSPQSPPSRRKPVLCS